MYYRLIAPDWLTKTGARKVLEGEFSDAEIAKHNKRGYNVYYLPNDASQYPTGRSVDGTDVDQFRYVFVDCDLKDGTYPSKEAFYEVIAESGIGPSRIVDSGNGVHVYWAISNLDPISYLRFQRRLSALFHTDRAVGQLFQLMRVPGTMNTKNPDNQVPCELLFDDDGVSYSAEEFDRLLPPITPQDETYCQEHFNRTHRINEVDIDDTMPAKWGQLLLANDEVKRIWANPSDDRSRDDYRLGHLMFANGFTKEEALSVLVNTAKAMARAPTHRKNYAMHIVDKIWTYEADAEDTSLELSESVRDILKRSGDDIAGQRFACHKRIDNTYHGFRLGQVIGLVGGSGIGKTAFALNMFRWFCQENPDYHHFFVSLEQPSNEIALRWKTMCGADESLHSKVHVVSNYDKNGAFRHLSFDDIREYIDTFQKKTKAKVGCVVVDHIGALKKKGKNGENQDLMEICHAMKAFAVQTNTLLIMQSQASREKAGIGDLELNKDAAYGTVYFESYCDYLITLWQPLKRCHHETSCPVVTAFKFCKIRHKKSNKDLIKEDVCYRLIFDPETEQLRDITQQEKKAFDFWLKTATNRRKSDRKSDIIPYTSVEYDNGESIAKSEAITEAGTGDNPQTGRSGTAKRTLAVSGG